MGERVWKYEVHLSHNQRDELSTFARAQNTTTLQSRRARILLLSDQDHTDGRRADWEIGEIVGLSEKQVKRVRQKFVRDGVGPTLQRQRRSDAGTRKKLDGASEAQLMTLCCSTPPAGRERWTLQLLVDELVRLEVVADVCRETVRQCLKKTASSLGEANAFVSPKQIARGSSRTWNDCSTSTKRRTTRRTR